METSNARVPHDPPHRDRRDPGQRLENGRDLRRCESNYRRAPQRTAPFRKITAHDARTIKADLRQRLQFILFSHLSLYVTIAVALLVDPRVEEQIGIFAGLGLIWSVLSTWSTIGAAFGNVRAIVAGRRSRRRHARLLDDYGTANARPVTRIGGALFCVGGSHGQAEHLSERAGFALGERPSLVDGVRDHLPGEG